MDHSFYTVIFLKEKDFFDVVFFESQPYLPSSIFIQLGARVFSLSIHFFSMVFLRLLALVLSGCEYMKSTI